MDRIEILKCILLYISEFIDETFYIKNFFCESKNVSLYPYS